MTNAATSYIPVEAQKLLFEGAQTAHAWSDKPVPAELITEVLESIKWAPTEFNSSPARVLVITSDEARQRLLPYMADGNRQKTEVAPVTLIVAADHDFHEDFDVLLPGADGVKDMFAGMEERPYKARMNTSLQIGYLLLGLRSAGLAVGPMTGMDAKGIDQEFFPDGRHETMTVINVGYPTETSHKPRMPRLEGEGFFKVI